MLSPARTLLAFRAAGVLLLGFGVPAVATFIVSLLASDHVQDLAGGHPGAWLGIVEALAKGAAESFNIHGAPHLLGFVAGSTLLLIRPRRLVTLVRRLERL